MKKYRIIILSDNYQLPLPVSSFILFKDPTQLSASQPHSSGNWQMIVVS